MAQDSCPIFRTGIFLFYGGDLYGTICKAMVLFIIIDLKYKNILERGNDYEIW